MTKSSSKFLKKKEIPKKNQIENKTRIRNNVYSGL